MVIITKTETRPLDHLYDPVCVTAHAADHSRLTTKAVFKPSSWERVPNQAYMFSELAHYPRHNLRLTQKEEIPAHLDRSWHPTTAETNAHDISGPYRHRFHKRPLVAAMSAAPNIVMYEIRDQAKQRKVPEQVKVAPSRTIGTQSIYRESEAQTDPYTPEHTIRPNIVPEILTLTHLTYGNGLPASSAEVEIIERTRQKRIYDNMLPPTTDIFSFELRSQLMEAAELKLWALRESQIEELQTRRLEILKTALHTREQQQTTLGEEKVERLKRKKEKERDITLTTLQRRRVKILRQAFKRKNLLEVSDNRIKPGTRDVIAEYIDFSSHLYASKLRDGHIPETKTGKIEVQPSDLNSYADLVQLERSLPAHLLRVEVSDLEPATTSRKEQVVHSALWGAAEKLRNQKSQVGEGIQGDDIARRHHQHRNILERPETPRVPDDVLPEEEDLEMAVLLLQRVLRGRAAQNKMFEGKEKRLDLINELCTAERAVEEGTKASPQQFNTQAKKAIADNILGTTVASTLDDLSKELLRYQEERRIAVMVKLAERDRRLRQAQESGRRQAEERLREREDEMFRQIMGVHQGTMDSYLEETISSTVEKHARSRAVTEAHLHAENINKLVDAMESSSDAEQVRDMVGSLVLPNVPRELIQKCIKSVESQKYRVAAREALELSFSGVGKALT